MMGIFALGSDFSKGLGTAMGGSVWGKKWACLGWSIKFSLWEN
jgi:hypothetical protein